MSLALALGPLVERIKAEEGYCARPYLDQRGVLTIGYGTDLAEGISEPEAEALLRSRLEDAWRCWDDWPGVRTVSQPLRLGLTDMAYQLGCEGARSFRRFLAALDARDAARAVAELRDSRWARQTPARVEALVRIVRAQVGR